MKILKWLFGDLPEYCKEYTKFKPPLTCINCMDGKCITICSCESKITKEEFDKLLKINHVKIGGNNG